MNLVFQIWLVHALEASWKPGWYKWNEGLFDYFRFLISLYISKLHLRRTIGRSSQRQSMHKTSISAEKKMPSSTRGWGTNRGGKYFLWSGQFIKAFIESFVQLFRCFHCFLLSFFDIISWSSGFHLNNYSHSCPFELSVCGKLKYSYFKLILHICMIVLESQI